MLLQALLFLFLLSILFFLSQKIQTSIFNNVFIVTKNRNIAIGVLIVLLLPGTIVHELSHFAIATILRVPTGKLTILPTVEENGEVKAGKLFLGNTDPFRLSIIGLAPVLVGLTLIYIAGKFFLPDIFQLPTTNHQLITILGIYFLFVISITMFSSKKDVESLVFSIPIVLLLLISLYFVGVRIFLDLSLVMKLERLISDLNYFLAITVVLNLTVFLFSWTNLRIWSRFLGTKIGDPRFTK